MDTDNSTLQGVASISLWARLLLVGCYLLTRRLWLGIGLHAAWNYTQGTVFSGIVSGNAPPTGLWVSSVEGPDWLTGGSFGLEASPVALLVGSTAGVLMLVGAVRRGHIVPSRPGSAEPEAGAPRLQRVPEPARPTPAPGSGCAQGGVSKKRCTSAADSARLFLRR